MIGTLLFLAHCLHYSLVDNARFHYSFIDISACSPGPVLYITYSRIGRIWRFVECVGSNIVRISYSVLRIRPPEVAPDR